MRLLLINNGYPTPKNPKHASYLKSIHEGIEKSGCSVDLLVLDSDFSGKWKHYYNYLMFYFKLLFFGNYATYDFIYINNYPFCAVPLIFHLRKFKKLIIHWHGMEVMSKRPLKQLLFKFTAYFLPKTTQHITPSTFFAGVVAQKLKINPRKIFISPSGGIEVDKFKPENPASDSSILRLGFASALTCEKGMDLIIQLLQKRDDLYHSIGKKIEFYYLFYGKEKIKYESILKQIPETMKWNVLSSEEMPRFYNAIDVLLFPTHFDSLGLVCLEAMSCNKPVVGVRGFAVPEYVIPGITGELFEDHNLTAFISALTQCALNLSNYQPRKFIMENYSKEAIGEQYRAFFISIV